MIFVVLLVGFITFYMGRVSKLVKMTENGKNGHFGDPENPEKNGSYQKRTDLLICLDQIFQKNIPGV